MFKFKRNKKNKWDYGLDRDYSGPDFQPNREDRAFVSSCLGLGAIDFSKPTPERVPAGQTPQLSDFRDIRKMTGLGAIRGGKSIADINIHEGEFTEAVAALPTPTRCF
jgi:hypothetical protein